MGRVGHELAEDSVLRCLEEFQRLRRLAPRPNGAPFESFVLEWASFKRRIASVAAKCLLVLVPQVRAVYYTELSEDYAGRDVDLVVVLDEAPGDGEEVKETLEAILTKLAYEAGVELHALTAGSRPFEIHFHGERVLGRRSLILLAGRDGETAPLR